MNDQLSLAWKLLTKPLKMTDGDVCHSLMATLTAHYLWGYNGAMLTLITMFLLFRVAAAIGRFRSIGPDNLNP